MCKERMNVGGGNAVPTSLKRREEDMKTAIWYTLVSVVEGVVYGTAGYDTRVIYYVVLRGVDKMNVTGSEWG